MQPTSAMATCIAVSAPAAAVRASSVDVSSQRTAGLAKLSSMAHAAQAPVNGSTHETGFEAPPTAVTAQLQAADAMRQSQQAHIDAQREEYKRSQVQAQNELMNQHVSFVAHTPAIADHARRA